MFDFLRQYITFRRGLILINYEELRKFLIKKRKRLIQKYFAKNEIPLEMLEKLSQDFDSKVRYKLALAENLPPKILNILARDALLEIRSLIAAKPNVTPVILSILANDGEQIVRYLTAQRKDLTPNIIKTLINDQDRDVRLAVFRKYKDLVVNVASQEKFNQLKRENLTENLKVFSGVAIFVLIGAGILTGAFFLSAFLSAAFADMIGMTLAGGATGQNSRFQEFWIQAITQDWLIHLFLGILFVICLVVCIKSGFYEAFA